MLPAVRACLIWPPASGVISPTFRGHRGILPASGAILPASRAIPPASGAIMFLIIELVRRHQPAVQEAGGPWQGGRVALWQVLAGGERRLARGPAGRGPEQLLAASLTIDSVLGGEPGALASAVGGPAAGPVPAGSSILVPLGGQEVWAAGVTYTRSLDARTFESGTADVYQRVYQAERPELFLKAAPGRVRGPGEPVAIRADSEWDVPEPELAVVADRRGRIVGYMNGNDMSSRSIEGENPLYLPQAKVYTGSCAVGPCLVTADEVPDLSQVQIGLRVVRNRADMYRDTVNVSGLRRQPDDLVRWLFRALDFPVGVVLLTGTAIVPDPSFTLLAGDEVIIDTTGLGELRNVVEVVGLPRSDGGG
jgi:2-dehydro-3-deoxy-D-arabinonate dehydratase